MPVFIAAIGGMLLNLVGSLVGRVLLALGLSVVTYTGIDATVGFLKQSALNAFFNVPPEVLNILGYMRVGEAINIISSAILAKLVLNGLTGAVMKKWQLN